MNDTVWAERHNLQMLMQQQDNLRQQLLETEREIQVQAKRFWEKQGYTVMPRIERLRAAVMGDTNGNV